MKIRYYLRGLGLGILVTAIFFMVSGKNNQTMSDEMIKARARELGMTESGVLSDLAVAEEETVSTPEETEEVITTEEVSQETVSEEVTDVEETVAETVEEETISTEEMTSEETSDEESAEEETTVEVASQSSSKPQETDSETTDSASSNTEPVSVAVNRGEGSDTVSRHLQELGLVADAYEYDRYLMANGYDKRIGAGEHVIPAGATWEDIAKILCNMK